ncbi:hypothetical protein BB560_000054 [Smittium megazygosporum]|uniref:Uncharacterized protein n=1 Tax=Smittium megazygosporum TaxID=133381 RepID=A0A2T9ZLI3_9FUNG|nr:hypothetical protein BB560_000054 [Smittium megazygosporum]
MNPKKALWLVWLALFSILSFVTASTKKSRHNEMKKLAASAPNGLIQMSDTQAEELVFSSNDYNVFALFTASNPKYGCDQCIPALKTFKSMAEPMTKAKNSDKIFFVRFEPENAMPLFRKFQIPDPPKGYFFASEANAKNINNKPYIQINLFRPTSEITTELTKLSGIKVYSSIYFDAPSKNELLKRPFLPFSSEFLSVGMAVAISFSMLRQENMSVFKFFYGIVSAVTIVVFLVLSSGFVWTRIKRASTAPPSDTLASNFSSGLQDQYSNEPILVSSCYGITASSFIFLTKKAPTIKNPIARSIAILLALISVFVGTSYLYMFFKIKSPTYPYTLLF